MGTFLRVILLMCGVGGLVVFLTYDRQEATAGAVKTVETTVGLSQSPWLVMTVATTDGPAAGRFSSTSTRRVAFASWSWVVLLLAIGCFVLAARLRSRPASTP